MCPRDLLTYLLTRESFNVASLSLSSLSRQDDAVGHRRHQGPFRGRHRGASVSCLGPLLRRPTCDPERTARPQQPPPRVPERAGRSGQPAVAAGAAAWPLTAAAVQRRRSGASSARTATRLRPGAFRRPRQRAQPLLPLLPISEEWKERLRSLPRPAASAMVRRLDAASPLCYRLDKDKAGVRDPLQLAAFAGDVERVSTLLEREWDALPSAMKKKLRGTAQAFLEARAAAEEAAAADGAAQP